MHEIVALYQAFQKWQAETPHNGTLELDADGSGEIRLDAWQGDHMTTESVFSWSTLAEGAAAISADIESGFPRAKEFRRRHVLHKI